MTVPDFQTLMLPVLQAVASEETMTSVELRERVAAAVGLSAEDLAEMLPSGRQSTFANRVAWANIFLQRARLLEPVRRGTYRSTARGHEVLRKNPPRIDMKFLEQFPEYLEWRRNERQVEGEEQTAATITNTITPPQETIELAVQALDQDLRTALLARILQLSPEAFERLILDLLVAMGYGGGRAEMARQTQRSNDDGIDGVIKEDALGLDLVLIQAKRYTPPNAVGRPEMQGFVGSLAGNGTSKAIFVTTSTFTSGARDFIARIPNRVILIDGEELARLMIDYNVGVRVTQTFAIKDIDENAFEEG
ncbi:MAG: restriction endonuclease [Geminicoccaceae bacterium]|jgi:restriction system protein|nr:restriction endonuclease [Geminicoccaceae bacterium]